MATATKQKNEIGPNQSRLPDQPADAKTRGLWNQLVAKLHKIRKGQVIWVGLEPHLNLLVKSGQLCRGDVRMKRGTPHRCHLNAAKLWARDVKNTKLVTGYAFGEGIWYPHSWAVKNGKILETTGKNDRYFGVTLGPEDSLQMLFSCGLQECASIEEFDRFLDQFPQTNPIVIAIATKSKSKQKK